MSPFRTGGHTASGREDGRGGPHAANGAGGERGRLARSPRQIPPKGWRDVALRLKDQVRDDSIGLVAAGVAFFGMLALFPGLAALVSVYGLVLDPTTIEQRVAELAALPQEVRDLVTNQLSALAGQPRQTLGLTFAISFVVAVWSASKAARALIRALNIAYGEEEKRGLVHRTALVLAFTFGAVLMTAVALGAVAVLPAVLNLLGLGGASAWVTTAISWVLLLLLFVTGLSVVYRYGPSREKARWKWISGGSVLATLLWVVASAGFSLFVANFGNYGEMYGPLAAVVVLLLWLWISAWVVLLGAELDAEMELQTRVDTTTGEERPLGERGAHVADTIGHVP